MLNYESNAQSLQGLLILQATNSGLSKHTLCPGQIKSYCDDGSDAQLKKLCSTSAVAPLHNAG